MAFPMQAAMARAEIVGQTASNLQNLIINASANIGKIIKEKDINKKIDAAYQNAADNFVQQAVSMGTDETSARIKSQHFFRQLPLEGLDSETRIKNLLASGLRAEEYLENMKASSASAKLTQQKATSAQEAVSGGREYGMPKQIGAGGGTFTEQNITETAPPAQYQEEAMSTYGQMAAGERAPVQTTKELQQQPSIAALPKRPEPPKPMTEFQKEQIQLGKERNKIAKISAERQRRSSGQDLLKQRDENIKWSRTQRRLVDGNIAKYKNYITSIEKIIHKIEKDTADNKITELTIEERDKLSDMGVSEANMLNIKKLDQLQSEYVALSEKNTLESKEFVNMEKFLRKNENATLAEGFTFAEEQTEKNVEQQRSAAYNYIRERATPTLYSSVDMFLNALPENLRPVIEEEISEVQDLGASDQEILQALKIKTQQVR